MTKAELLEKLKELTESDYPEMTHREADDLLIDFINDTEIKEAFEAIAKWYD